MDGVVESAVVALTVALIIKRKTVKEEKNKVSEARV